MKAKKAISLFLSLVMVLGLIPVSAMAATDTEVGKVTGNSITDTTADPNKSYEYTVTGSDGSTQTVTVPAKGTEPTGNSVKPQEVPGAVYYQKVTDPANAKGEGYLLVDTATKQAVSNKPGVEGVTIQGDRINGDHATAEWTVATSDGKISFANGTNRLTISQTKDGSGEHGWLFFPSNPWKNFEYAVAVNNNEDNFKPVISGDSFTLSRDYNERAYNDDPAKMVSVYLNFDGTSIMGDKNHATSFTLFQKKTEPSTTEYTVDATGLDALIAEAGTKDKALYEPATWAPFENALKAAETAKAGIKASYATEQEARDALAAIDAAHRELKRTMDALKLLPAPETITPVIDWNRTLEYVFSQKRRGSLVTGLDFLDLNSPNFSKIQWNWNSVKNLTTDPSMTIWDYNTPKQYSEAVKRQNVIAATWNDRDRSGNVEKEDWQKASVRKFAGTFIWPEGYTLEDKAVITSVNDANYQGIYDYVNNDPALKERFGGKKIIPVNDDMYVYVYKDGEDPTTWTNEEAAKHLVFWTGSSGKGMWSQENRGGGDWLRETPATYLDKAAVPAYHGVMPNMRDVDAQAAVGSYDDNGKSFENTHKLHHTDGWYTMVDTNTLMSTLNRLYPGEQLSGKMHFDIYAFDNSNNGGMDQLEIRFEKAPVTTTQVTVKYWLNDTTGTPLGSTVINGAEVGSTIRLSNGTANNELNHFKAAAITKANADVTDGKPDYGTEGYVVKKTNNVINVVYTARNQGEVIYYTYDFGVTNQYTYGDQGITKVTMESSDAGFSVASAKDGKAVFSYTPQNALGQPAYATLNITQSGGSRTVKVCVIPASNVLYEENFITGDWSKTNHSNVTVSDNNDNVYGHTAAYNASTGANGEYTAAVNAATKKTNDLKFSFNGIGLDLIGSCGPDYGTLAVKVMQGNKVVKTYIVNTGYAPGVIHQVPLLHANAKDLSAGVNYDVTVRGMYVAPASAVSTMSVNGGTVITPDLYEQLLDLGLTDADMDKVEFVNAADNLPESSVSTFSAVPAAAAGEQTVAVDSFRVYRSTEKAAVAYAENEKNLIYTNVMDEAITGDFSAYVEQDAQGKFTTKTYEGKGGPENELYLEPGTGIAFGTDATYAQVSLRAVNGDTQANHSISLTHNTEMYYEVTVDNGMVTIANTGSELLAIGNLKTNGNIKTIENKDAAVKAVAMMFAAPQPEPDPEPEVPQTFEPDRFKLSARASGLFRRTVTMTAKTSDDVAYLMVNGEKVMPQKPLFGWGKNKTFKTSQKVSRHETARFEVVAYNAEGVASQVYVIEK